MPNDDYFVSAYVNNTEDTTRSKNKSEVKILLKESIKEEDMSVYGSSKPKRIVIKAKITNA